MKYKEIICEYCGKRASVPTLRKAKYCDDCKSIAHNNAVKSSASKKKEQVALAEYDASMYMYKKEIMDLCNRCDELRKEAIYWWNKARNEAEHYTKTGDMLLHQLEFLDLSDNDILKNAHMVKTDRAIRRGRKVSALVLFEIVCSFGLRNATKFGEKAIEGAKTEKEFQKYLEKLKYDKELYSRALREENK